MKKSLIIALGAIALVACTKTSVSYEQTGEIGFAPVVRKNSTKAAVQGAVQGATFPEQNIKVFGYYDNSMPVGKPYKDGNFAVEYLPGVEFAKKGTNWAGATTPYYWPKTGSMLFAGYSPVDFAGVTFSLASNKFSVAELDQPEFSATKDLLYAGYTTSVLGGTAPMTFSHALSWVTIKAKAAAADQIKITNIKFVGLAAKASSAGLPEWTVSGTKEQLNVFAPTSAFAVPAAETLVESNENCGLVFPQTLADAAEIVVSYKMNNGAGQWFAQAPFVKKLNSLKSGADTINKWEAGKHYTYIINFSTIAGGPDSSNEITIAPTVNDWESVIADGISAN